MPKSPEKSDSAFRTIREVADWLGVPTHVLRFWESKFDQIAPVKGAGGRRYYRPEDMRLLGGIKVLLHDDGLTIRAVAQRIEEGGVDPIRDLSPELAAEEPTPAPRTRRVIRKGDPMGAKDTASKPTPPEPKRTESPPPVTPEPTEPTRPAPDLGPPRSVPDPVQATRPAVPIARDHPTPLFDSLPEQPDAPVSSNAATPPADPLPEAPTPDPAKRPLDWAPPGLPPAVDDTAAPADPPHQLRHAPEPEPDLPAARPADPVEPPASEPAADAPYPLTRARRLARGAEPLAPLDRKRLRRLVRRYRALSEEIAEDLSEGSSR
ncbi:MerR family transcriptional regulator [Jannaschia seohaensis]|uniref:MerR HTH family regulatory protein n=1 Tax=Jannaschia seohaensis TaxID=475081 RepID=A0A2Y9C7I5_9RHOB|nr:MerR family transcriptional regulator [Jannaschia seohaensis]PWJ19092.1 MerR-like DNA binding protein [Jannaschia seohaensis]SSA45713.1 MerR HTH family regulatory protein [Jannaschia seohaensis]